MQNFFILFGLFLVLGCTHTRHQPRTPSSSVTHTRLYFSTENCQFDKWTLLGSEQNPYGMNLKLHHYTAADFPTGMIEIRFYTREEKLVDSFAAPTTYVDISPNRTFLQCDPHIFFDIPIDTDLSTAVYYRISSPFKSLEETQKHTWSADYLSTSLKERPRTLKYPSAVGEPYRIVEIARALHQENAWNLVILGDGYTKQDFSMESEHSILNSEFGKAGRAAYDALIQHEPFKSLKDHINVRVVATHSKDRGISFPSRNIRRQTFYQSQLGAFCMDRLPSVRNELRVAEMLAYAGAHQGIMFAKSEFYGGSGGNIPIVTVTENLNHTIGAVVHELGHSIAGLGDQYHHYPSFSTTTPGAEQAQQGIMGGTHCGDLGTGIYSLPNGSRRVLGNLISNDESKTSPNYASSPQAAQAKWKKINGAPLALIETEHPSGLVTLTPNSFRLKFNTKNPIRVMTTFSPLNRDLERLTDVLAQDGQGLWKKIRFAVNNRPYRGVDGKLHDFWLVQFNPPISSGTQALDLHFNADVSRVFTGIGFSNTLLSFSSGWVDQNQLAIVRGGFPGIEGVFRSSMISIMGTTNLPGITFDAVETLALRKAVCAELPKPSEVIACR